MLEAGGVARELCLPPVSLVRLAQHVEHAQIAWLCASCRPMHEPISSAGDKREQCASSGRDIRAGTH